VKQSTLLAILQQSEYDLNDFTRWYNDHKDEDLDIKPDKLTTKLQLIKKILPFTFFLPELQRIIVATKLVQPIDALIRQVYYALAKSALWLYRKKGLQVVAIAGSYGKTSTKSIAAHALSSQKEILVTPKSINTLLGIAQVILHDLKPNHDVFIIEFGEYNADDITHLTKFTTPDFAIITPIGRQHLERFGSLKKIAATFLPLISFFKKNPQNIIIEEQNIGLLSPLIPQVSDMTCYGVAAAAQLRLENTKVTRQGTEFNLVLQNKNAPEIRYDDLFIPLYGTHQAINALASIWLADVLDLDISLVSKQLASTPYVDRRHQPHFAENNVLILDNSYNTNPDSATASLALINQLEASRRLIITPGFVELGAESSKIHFEFGTQLAGAVDYVGLIEAPWTESIIEGFVEAGGKREHMVTGSDFDQALAKLSGMIIANSIVLFEGGFREIYT